MGKFMGFAGLLIAIALMIPLRVLELLCELPLSAVRLVIEYVKAFGDDCQRIMKDTDLKYDL